MGEAAAICIFELAFQKDEKILMKKKKQKAKINQQGTIDDRNGTTAAANTR